MSTVAELTAQSFQPMDSSLGRQGPARPTVNLQPTFRQEVNDLGRRYGELNNRYYNDIYRARNPQLSPKLPNLGELPRGPSQPTITPPRSAPASAPTAPTTGPSAAAPRSAPSIPRVGSPANPASAPLGGIAPKLAGKLGGAALGGLGAAATAAREGDGPAGIIGAGVGATGGAYAGAQVGAGIGALLGPGGALAGGLGGGAIGAIVGGDAVRRLANDLFGGDPELGEGGHPAKPDPFVPSDKPPISVAGDPDTSYIVHFTEHLEHRDSKGELTYEKDIGPLSSGPWQGPIQYLGDTGTSQRVIYEFHTGSGNFTRSGYLRGKYPLGDTRKSELQSIYIEPVGHSGGSNFPLSSPSTGPGLSRQPTYYPPKDPAIKPAPTPAPDSPASPQAKPYIQGKPLPAPTGAPSASPNASPGPSPDLSPYGSPDAVSQPDPNTNTIRAQKIGGQNPFLPGAGSTTSPIPLPVPVPIPGAVPGNTPTLPPPVPPNKTGSPCNGNPCGAKLNKGQELANSKLDDLLKTLGAGSNLANLALLPEINKKLGPQVEGGLSGFLKRFWNNTIVTQAVSWMSLITTIHNAYMLSSGLSQTLFSMFSNGLAAVGIKDAEGSPLDIQKILGTAMENIAKDLLGEQEVNGIKEAWKKYNRIYQAATNLLFSIQSIYYSILGALEIIGSYVAKIGNALRKFGVVAENAYNFMNPSPNFENRFFRAITATEEVASNLDSIASEVLSVQDTTKQLKDQREELQKAVGQPEGEKPGREVPEAAKVKEEQTKAHDASQSPNVEASDLIRPEPNGGSPSPSPSPSPGPSPSPSPSPSVTPSPDGTTITDTP